MSLALRGANGAAAAIVKQETGDPLARQCRRHKFGGPDRAAGVQLVEPVRAGNPTGTDINCAGIKVGRPGSQRKALGVPAQVSQLGPLQ